MGEDEHIPELGITRQRVVQRREVKEKLVHPDEHVPDDGMGQPPVDQGQYPDEHVPDDGEQRPSGGSSQGSDQSASVVKSWTTAQFEQGGRPSQTHSQPSGGNERPSVQSQGAKSWENPYYGSVVRSMPTAGMRTQAGSQGQRSSGGSEMAPPQEPSVASGEPKDAELKRNNGGSQGAASQGRPSQASAGGRGFQGNNSQAQPSEPVPEDDEEEGNQ